MKKAIKESLEVGVDFYIDQAILNIDNAELVKENLNKAKANLVRLYIILNDKKE